ncbi:MAG TPA: MarR family winged helix-turn-helix transcriptional regulator [Chitinophagales bacterium]|nr:MarR family winged helix-turn-helix transcriptional regulator [Chitinophagales bacterium]
MPSIEELIQQNKFKDEKHKAIISVLYTANVLNNFHEDFFSTYQLTSQQYNALRILRGQYPKPATINLIRERMMDKMSDASRIVERLRKSGFVERVVSKKDRRAVDVVITEKGLEVLAAIDKQDDKTDKPTKYLSQQEAAELSRLLGKMLDALTE